MFQCPTPGAGSRPRRFRSYLLSCNRLAVLVLLAAVLLLAPDAARADWHDFLAGRCDLERALAGDSRGPEELTADLEATVLAAGPDWTPAAMKLGALYIKLGRPQDAIPLLQRTRTAVAGDLTAAAFCDLQLGRALVHTRQVQEAAAALGRARDEARTRDIPLWVGDACIALSVLDRWAMDLDSSLAHRREALAAYRAIGYAKGIARAQHYIGTIHVFRGELTRALQVLQEALETAREADFRVEIAGSLADLAGVNLLLGDFRSAELQYEEAARLTSNPWRRGQLANNLGALLAKEGQHAAAIGRFEEALDLMRQVGDRRLQAEILLSLGRSQYELRDFANGVAHLDSAIVLAREWQVPVAEAYALQYKGCAMLDQDRLDEAVRYLEQAETLAADTGFFDIREACLWARALVDRRSGDLPAALARLREAVRLVDDVRRRSAGSAEVQSGYFSQTRRTFDELIDLLYELHGNEPGAGYDEQALAVVQQAKARGFLDQLREAEVDLRSLADPQVQQRERELLERIAALEQQEGGAARIAELETELKLLEADLRRSDPRYAELKYPRPCTLAEARDRVLQPGELLLEYHLGQNASYLWAISPDHFAFHRLPPADEITRQVEDLLPMLHDYNLLGDDAAWFTAQAVPLADLLLGPERDRIQASRRVIVAGDGILHTLPFAALPVSATTARDFSELPYLVRYAEVVSTPSLSALQRLREAATSSTARGEGLLLVGRPRPEHVRGAGVFARAAGVEDLDEVPFALEEIAGITAAWGAGRVEVLAGPEATVENLQAAAARPHRVLHFTTHGLYNARRPLYSGLVLEPGPGSDSFLAVNEIFGLDLPVRQVVLSACSSALGRQIGGEGLVGMSRAFLYAGARSVLAAAWDVAGSSTASFMAAYYEQQIAHQEGPAAALARTQRRMIAGELRRADGGSASHPAFWAPFVLTGSP